ncbi:3-hydroxyacyl-CoA dehydrogenase NAD-binding domain-containing protein [Caulobacter sp. KR2-114]|uniref:3-hydroxyacyl-CoA dehydrogenase NAD-binding domain-containing protein n=1 Tax=Caulobacter sp. KR2-114 TaxID=3400912 RepID=UPI003C12A36F
MSDVIRTDLRGDIAIVRIDSPPVNALGHAVRAGLAEALGRLASDDSVRAIVLVGEGRGFISGADIREFGRPAQAPSLDVVIDALENSAKPVVAGIHGVALGGGLEVALACHFRVSTAGARLGLPEVTLGLLPGAGGTQRLPRAVGPALAVKMIAGGAPLSGEQALAAGLIDEVVADPTAGAEAFARRALAEGRSLRRLRDDDSRLAAARADRSIFTDAATAATARNRGLDAPRACVEAVGWALDLPFDEALVKEREAFQRLMKGDQSKAQRHVFFAEREAAKIAGLPEGVRPRPLNRVAIIGAGTMGGGIAMAFANGGVPVTLIELSEAPLKRGLEVIRKNYEASAARGGLAAEAVEARTKLIEGAVGIDKVGEADLVIEAVFETMAVKKEVFAQLDAAAKAGAVLATNTSYLDVDEIASATSRPQDVVGMHFFSPANVMKLCEIVRGAKTAPDVLATAAVAARKAAKAPVVVGVCFGFVGNRMLGVRGQQASKLMYQGVAPQQMDGVLTGFGMPMGHFAMADLAGLDVAWRSRQDHGESAPIEDALCEAGRLGQKTGKGFYQYAAGSRAPLVDPEVETLIRQTMERLGLPMRQADDAEILERLVYPMINEGAKILEEGIAARPGDIDVVWLFGYGWPVFRGGPMFYADQVGLKTIVERLAHYAAADGDTSLEPAPLLARLADQGKTFADWRP